ncbi:MAG: replication initiator protein A [Eubacteriales bacterium]|nr:replication initiator protein A [Eubacteriales bacterium]
MEFDYFRAEQSEQFSFFRIPKALFTEKEFESLSTDAKLLYGVLLDRLSLSRKNGWVDASGYVYIIYTVSELQELFQASHPTVIKWMRELDSVHGIGLIERYKQGYNRPAIIYVKNFVKRTRVESADDSQSGMKDFLVPGCKNLSFRNAKIFQ